MAEASVELAGLGHVQQCQGIAQTRKGLAKDRGAMASDWIVRHGHSIAKVWLCGVPVCRGYARWALYGLAQAELSVGSAGLCFDRASPCQARHGGRTGTRCGGCDGKGG